MCHVHVPRGMCHVPVPVPALGSGSGLHAGYNTWDMGHGLCTCIQICALHMHSGSGSGRAERERMLVLVFLVFNLITLMPLNLKQIALTAKRRRLSYANQSSVADALLRYAVLLCSPSIYAATATARSAVIYAPVLCDLTYLFYLCPDRRRSSKPLARKPPAVGARSPCISGLRSEAQRTHRASIPRAASQGSTIYNRLATCDTCDRNWSALHACAAGAGTGVAGGSSAAPPPPSPSSSLYSVGL
jgi:hypothetical protein